MKRGLDTNVLIYAQMPVFPEHEIVRKFLLTQLALPDMTLVVTPNILHEFIHIVTDGRRFDPPVSMAQAITLVRLYLGRTNVECVSTSESILLEAFSLIEHYNLGRKRIADTLFAATLMHFGVRELITCNPDDFRLFKDLKIIDPRYLLTLSS